MENLMLRLQGSTFRVFLHPPAAMRAVLAEHGLRPEPVRGGVWRIVAASR
jgi:magnesium-protoporphyrin O-methyltransferase